MQEIKRIKAVSLAKIVAVFYGLTGFLISLGVAVLTIVNMVTQGDFVGSVMMVALFNIGAGILLGLLVALVTGFLGWLLGYVVGVIYNRLARRFGGIKIDFIDAGPEVGASNEPEPENKKEETKELNSE